MQFVPSILLQVLLAVTAIAGAVSAAPAASPFVLNYSGRLTDASGKPVAGTVLLRIRFFRAPEGGDALAIAPDDMEVDLAHGMFQVPLSLSAEEFHEVFNGQDQVWVQVTDVTHNLTFPRQHFSAAPYALKVPVDQVTLEYNAEGQLRIKSVAHATHADNADQADTATNASHATTADTATNAGHATTADTATNATHADSADTAVTANQLNTIPVQPGTPGNNKVLKYSTTNSRWEFADDQSEPGAGEANTASTVGGSASVYKTKNLADLQFRGLSAGAGISVTQNADDITIAAAVTSVAGRTGSVSLSMDDVSETIGKKWYSVGEQSKLAGIESGADVTDAANVAAAGAVMDSDYANGKILVGTAVAGTYTQINNDSANWNAAYSWGDHAIQGYIGLTDLSATPPVSYSSGTGVISMEPASGSTSGYLSSANFNIFNGKQDAIIGTTDITLDQLTANGDVRLRNDAATQSVTIKARDAATTSWSMVLPDNDGNNLDVLQTDGAGNLSWVPIPSAPVTSVNGDTGVVVLDAADIAPTATRLWLADTDKAKLDGIATGADDVNGTTVAAAGAVMDSDYANGKILVGTAVSGTYTQIDNNSGNWNTAYTDRLKWDGTVVGDGSAGAKSTARSSLELVIGTDVQAQDPALQSIAGLTTSADQMIYTTGPDAYATHTLTSAVRTLFDDATVGDMRTTLGLGNVQNTNVLNSFNQNDAQYFGTDEVRARDVGGLKLTDDAGVLGVFVEDGGRVGIGTSSPSAKLEIRQPTNDTGVGLELAADSSVGNTKVTSLQWVRHQYDPTGIAASIDFWRGGDAAEGIIAFSTNPGSSAGQNPTERLRITKAGNIGIGTDNPLVILDVKAGADADGIRLLNAGGTVAAKIAQTGTDAGEFRLNDAGAAKVYFSSDANVDHYINNGGSVGIGTSTPGAKLDLHFDGTVDTAVSIKDTSNSNNEVIRLETATGNGLLALFDSSGSRKIQVRADGSDNYIATGDLGIGTTDPAARLDVAGDIKMGNSSATCNGTTEGSQRYNSTAKKMEFCNGSNWAAVEGDKFLLQTLEASNSATVDFTGIDGTYKSYEILIMDAVPSLDAKPMFMRVSTDNGSTWDSGASAYQWANIYTDYNVGPGRNSDAADSEIPIADESSNQRVGNAAGEGFHATLILYNPASTTIKKIIRYRTDYINEAGQPAFVDGQGFYQSTSAINGIRFFFSTGNITSGTFKLYGIR